MLGASCDGGAEASCDAYAEAVATCLDAFEAATGASAAAGRPDSEDCPADDDADRWACRAEAFASSTCDDEEGLAEIRRALTACEGPG